MASRALQSSESREKKNRELLTIGRVRAPYGVKGWIHLTSSTEPAQNIFKYTPWWLKTRHGVKRVEIEEFRDGSKGYVVKFKNVHTRDDVEVLVNSDICVEPHCLPDAQDGEYYWKDLIGLDVITHFDRQELLLGQVVHLMETGSNDVLVVKPCDGSIDDRERLVPFIIDQFVIAVDSDNQQVMVDWDPSF